MKLYFKICIFAVLLSSCGGTDPNLLSLRKSGNGPDEFALITRRAIEMPSDFSTLPLPTQGGSNLTDKNPQEDVVVALGGSLKLSENLSDEEDKSIQKAVARFGIVDDIRNELALADEKFRAENKGLLLERLVNMNVYFRAYSSMTLDSEKEKDRLSELGVKILSASPKP